MIEAVKGRALDCDWDKRRMYGWLIKGDGGLLVERVIK